MKKSIAFLFILLFAAAFTSPAGAQTISCQWPNVVGALQPAGMALDNGGNVWAAFFQAGYVLQISVTNCTQLRKVIVQKNPDGVAFDGTNIWVTNYGSNTVSKINVSSGSLLANYPVGGGPRGVVFDGTYIWVANSASNTVTKLQPSTGALLGNFAVGTTPWFMAVDPINTTIWVANGGSNNVMSLNQSGTILHTVAVGSSPLWITFDGTNMWASTFNGKTVYEISPNGVVLKSVSVSAHGGLEGLTWDPYDGLIWGVTWGGYVYSLNPSTNAVLYTWFGGHNLYGIIFDSNSRFLWISDIQDGVVDQVVP